MKLKTLAATLAAMTLAPLSANAGVTVTPLLLGYQYNDMDKTVEAQQDVLDTDKDINGDGKANGISKEGGLWTGAALGVELTPTTQFQVEYGVSNTENQEVKNEKKDKTNRFDVEQETISGNLLIGAETEGNLKPYLLVGAGQSKIDVTNQKAYTGKTAGEVAANTVVSKTRDTIGNVGLGAMYRVNDTVSLRGEGRAVHNFDNKWWEGMAVAGLEVVLGGHLDKPAQPAPEPAPVDDVVIEKPEIVVIKETPKDSDGDGVNDKKDACPGTPSSLVVDARGCPQQVNVSKDWKMELRIFFDNDKSAIKDQYKPEIAKVAEVMNQYPTSNALIEGHASKTGPSARYNQRLSEARAVAVKSVLTDEFGVAANRLATQGFGYDRPIAPNDTAEGRAMNRRVYAVINGKKTQTVNKTKNMK